MGFPLRQVSQHGVSRRSVAVRRAALSCAVALAMTGVGGVYAPVGQAAPLSGPSAPAAAPSKIEGFAPYRWQTSCDPVAKPGTRALAEMMLAHYGAGRSGGITRGCSIGGRSEHKEGRAWDWMLNVSKPAEKAVAEQFIDWLTAPGGKGKDAYNARRLGVMYVIWNGKIWSASREGKGWQPYRGPNPHTDHIHVSLSWSGAMRETSFWTGERGDVKRSCMAKPCKKPRDRTSVEFPADAPPDGAEGGYDD